MKGENWQGAADALHNARVSVTEKVLGEAGGHALKITGFDLKLNWRQSADDSI